MRVKQLLSLGIILLVGFTQFSCQNSDEETSYRVQRTIKFDIEKDTQDEEDFSKHFSVEKIVPLSSSQNLIGGVGKVLFDKTKIYILDNITNSLHIYSHSGDFIFKIKAIGQGPSEYNQLSDFIIFKDKIVILDSYSSKLLFYDLSGNFIKKISLDSLVKNIATDDSILFLYNGNMTSYFSDDNIRVISEEGEALNKFIKIPSFLKDKSILSKKPFIKQQKEVLFYNFLGRDIYHISKDSVYIAYRLDFGDQTLDNSFLKKNKNIGELLLKANKEGKVFAIDYINDTKQFLSFIFIYKGKTSIAFYDKDEDRGKIYPLSDFSSSLKDICTPILGVENEMFVTAVIPSSLEENSIQKEFFGNLENEDNPVLLFYKLGF